MLDGWFIELVKGIVFTNTAMFKTLKLIVTAFLVLALKIIEKRLLNFYLLFLFWGGRLILIYAKVNFRL